MAWTDPRIWPVGHLVAAADLNEQIRDNENFLYGPPAARITHNTTQSASNLSNVTLTFNTEVVDTDSMYAGGSPTILTVNTAGVYFVGFTKIGFAGHATGLRLVRIDNTGAFAKIGNASVATDLYMTGATLFPATASFTFQTIVFHNAGVARNILADPVMFAHWTGGP